MPPEVRGFRIRIELADTSRPIWRRLEVPSNTELPQLHLVLQAAMGWNDAHLHQFRVEDANNEGEFLTSYDFAEGLQGQPEAGIRLDQILNKVGDELWYSYDFGDGWEHLLQLEAVLDSPPKIATCIAGELACPPEDCGGIGGYESLAAWVRADYAHELLPPVFEEAWIAREWLPRG